MTTSGAAARPVPLSRVWSGSTVLAENLDSEDLADVLQYHADASAWLVLPREGGWVLRQLASGLALDERLITDVLGDGHRSKFEHAPPNRVLLADAVTFDPEQARLDVHPLSIVVTDRVLVCLTDRHPGSFDPAKWLAENLEQGEHAGVHAAIQLLVLAMIKSYEEVVDWLEEGSDHLAEALFEERPLTKSEQLWAFKLRTMLSQLRRLTDPMRSVISDLSDSYQDDSAVDHQVLRREWTLLTEHHNRVANAADSLREALASVFDTSLALADLRMNQIMKKLTSWAAIIAVPTLVTGFVGMNVIFPLDGTRVGFYLYSTLIIVPVVILFFVFRRKDWL